MHDLPPMVIHDLVQGTEAWAQFRLEHDGASEAAAMLGLSTKVKRSELLRIKKVGLPHEFSQFVQERVLDRGHEVEALARPLIEARIDDTLYPLTVSRGRLSASCDGLTFDNRIAFEHKQLAQELFLSVERGIVPDEHMPQCQQILLVTGAEKVLFVVSDGTADKMAVAEVFPDVAWFKRILDGWEQFHKDLTDYTPAEPAAPEPVGKAPETLPALLINVTGAVTASNLPEFKATALAAIRSVNRELKTDQDFANADKAVKWCAEVESRLKAAKEHALSQTASIDALFKALDDIAAESKTVRLDLGKLIDRRKVERKEEAVTAARSELDAHIASLNTELAPIAMKPAPVDFAGAIKGMRSFASMDDALRTAVANGKIAANDKAQAIRANLATYRAEAAGMESLFPDLATIAHKPADDFKTLVQARVAKHKADLEARERAIREQAERDAAAKLAREQEAAAKAQREAEAKAAAEAAAKAAAEAKARDDALKAMTASNDGAAVALDAEIRQAHADGEIQPADAKRLLEDLKPSMPVKLTFHIGGGSSTEQIAAACANAAKHVQDGGEATGDPYKAGQQLAQYVQRANEMASGAEALMAAAEARAQLLRDCHALTAVLAQAFAGKFPSHPKPEKAWWDDVRARVEALKPALAAATAQEVEA